MQFSQQRSFRQTFFSPGVTSKRTFPDYRADELTSVPFGGFPMCHGAGGLADSTGSGHGRRANIYAV